MTVHASNQETYVLLYSQLETELSNAEAERQPSQGFSAMIKLVRHYIGLLKEAVALPFVDDQAEIAFFRDALPKFQSKLFYYQLINAFESDRHGQSSEAQASLTAETQAEISEFFSTHKEFWNYYRENADIIDLQFTRKFSQACHLDPLSAILDKEWGTIAGYRVARALAFEAFATYLARAKESLSHAGAPTWEWRESKTAAAELIYALTESASIFIDGKQATATQLRAHFEDRFHVDLAGFSKLIYATDLRKKEDTPFLTKLIAKFHERKDRQRQ